MDRYSAMESNEVPTHATTLMNLENVLRKGSQAEKGTYVRFHLYDTSNVSKSLETEFRLVVGSSWGGVEGLYKE